MTTYSDKYKINPTIDLEKKDREHIAEIVYDYLQETYGDIASFNFTIEGDYEVASFEYKGKRK